MVFRERISAVACSKGLCYGLNYSIYSEMIQKKKVVTERTRSLVYNYSQVLKMKISRLQKDLTLLNGIIK